MTIWFYVAALQHRSTEASEPPENPLTLLLGPFTDHAHATQWVHPVRQHTEALTPLPRTSFVITTIDSPDNIPAPEGLLNDLFRRDPTPRTPTAESGYVPPAVVALLRHLEQSADPKILTDQVRETLAPLLPPGLDFTVSREHRDGPRTWFMALTQRSGNTIIGAHGPSLADAFLRLKTQIDQYLASL